MKMERILNFHMVIQVVSMIAAAFAFMLAFGFTLVAMWRFAFGDNADSPFVLAMVCFGLVLALWIIIIGNMWLLEWRLSKIS